MTANDIFELIGKNPVFHLATMDGDQPRVRGMLLFRADKNGIVFLNFHYLISLSFNTVNEINFKVIPFVAGIGTKSPSAYLNRTVW